MSLENKCCSVRVGMSVADFELDTFDPKEAGFGKVSMEQLKSNGKWTVLFFYPADFTFV